MKQILLYNLIFVLWLIGSTNLVYSQTCSTCPDNDVTGTKASAFGDGNTASGNYSFVAGRNSEANQQYATVLGSWSFAEGGHSYVFGSQSQALGNFSYVVGNNSKSREEFSLSLGHNLDSRNGGFTIGVGRVDSLLTNNFQETLIIGFNSPTPTVFVGRTSFGNQSGRVGIGNITAPQAKLHIRADAGEPATLRLEATGTSGDNIYSRMLFTPNHSIQAANNQNLTFTTQSTKHFVFQNGYVGIGVTNPAKPLDVQGDVRASGSFFMGDNPIRSSQWENFESDVFYNQGNVGIGTNATNGYKLAVAGKIIAQEMRIVHTVPESDYVFKPDYPLMPLNELQAFINANSHLPEVPSAAEFKENGYSIGTMDDLLLRKIEELTLYILQQQQEIEKLKEIVERNP